MSSLAVELSREAERLEEDVLWAEKSHFMISTVWSRVHYWLGLPNTLFAALAGVSAINSYEILAALLAVITAILAALLTFLDPESRASAHKNAGAKHNALRGKLRRLRLIELMAAQSEVEVKQQLDVLAQEKASLTSESPHTGGFAYKLARRSIERNQHKYEVDSSKADNEG